MVSWSGYSRTNDIWTPAMKANFGGIKFVIMAMLQRLPSEQNQMMKVGTSTEAFFSFALRFSSSSFLCLRLTR